MKTAEAYRTYNNMRSCVAYPNAATTKEMVHKVLDGLLMIASGAGIATIILFILLI